MDKPPELTGDALEAMAQEHLSRVADASVHTFDPNASPEAKRAEAESAIPADLLPDLHNLQQKQSGIQTELATHDAADVKRAVTAAEQKPMVQPINAEKSFKRLSANYAPSTPRTPTLATAAEDRDQEIMAGSFIPPPSSLIPDWYQLGWTSFSTRANPGGPMPLRATQSKMDALDELMPNLFYGEWWHNAAALFITAVMAWSVAKMGGGLGTVIVGCLVLATYYRTSVRRFRENARDDIQRELAKIKLEADEEPVEWMNSFLEKFWLIFEPVLSALVVENLDTYLSDYLPSYIDSIRLTTFTLGTKPFRVKSVKTYLNTEPDTVCMDWRVSFTPNDLTDADAEERDLRVNPRVLLSVRMGRGVMTKAAIPVLVENMTFSGHMRVKIKFVSRFPYAQILDVCFLEKPMFDYVLRPLSRDSFGFDVNVIPGLHGFIRDQVHAILGPLMYAPNVFTFDIEKFMAGEFDITQANGILAITVYAASQINHVHDLIDGSPNPYLRFFLDHAQELGRTNVRENTFVPQWNETRFLLLNNLNSQLSLELRTHNADAKDRRLATAHFDLRELDDEDSQLQEGLDLVLLRDGKAVSDVRVDLRYLPVSKPMKRMDGTIEPAVESNSGILRLIVHECRGLGTARLTTRVHVIVNGTEKFKTATVKRTSAPHYETPGEMVVLDKTEVYIRIELQECSGKEEVVLGVWTSYLLDMMKQQEENENWFPLNLDNHEIGQLRLSAQWKPVVMTGLADYVGSHGFDTPPIGVVRFVFWEARDLRNVENVASGKSDPYVRVLSGFQIRARTKVIDNNLSPEWGEVHYVPVHSTKENLVLEVMDWNARTRDKSLGSTEVRLVDLVRQCVGEQSVDPDRWYESTGLKIDEWAQLRSSDRRSAKGELRYTAEFIPTLALPQQPSETTELSNMDAYPNPLKDLHGSYVNYTPDDLVDLLSYSSGVLKVHIHEVDLPRHAYAYAQVLVDSLLPQFRTAKLRGQQLVFDESADAFVKEIDFSRVAIEIKPASSTEKDDVKLGYWIDATNNIIHRIQARHRWLQALDEDVRKEVQDAGEWFNLLGTEGPGKIRLSFDYVPMSDFTLNPDESIDNQGNLTVTLLSAKDLMAADKSGTSDPYVIFTVNGERVHKSNVVKKTLSPVWKHEQFTVPIASRVTASLRIEVFDWNQFKNHDPIGSGGVTIRGDAVESFGTREVNIPLDGVAGVSGSVRVRFKWQPQLLASKKTQTSVLATKRVYTNDVITSSAIDSNLSLSPTRSTFASRSNVSNRYDSDNASAGAERVSFDGGEFTAPRSSMDASSIAPSVAASLDDAAHVSSSIGRDGTVNIWLLEAKGIRGVDKSGTSDPYVRVRVGKQQVYKTKVIKKTLLPVWNESFEYTVSSQPTVFDFKLKDYNRLHSAVDLGQCRWNIWDLIQSEPSSGVVDRWLPLYPVGSGELHVRITFSPHL
ncbi:uncharacterized protein BYT42DRAFT_575688 [Radiomyces spectabilis]|uniref:uncharacterized protein n=1 Tax=Radiomyces spectabilis TaxID=64574 RepID=UPI002220AE78|nr:uncharacterized protein BYT42DRAFT_575688 [Radiomyces spectabilis]KAI8374245.1 hypothetical protein BYT42DRAFT_575688 [Radiomyces spectabilis]